MEGKKSNFLPILLNTFIILILFAIVLFVLNKKGYVTFNFKDSQTDAQSSQFVTDNKEANEKDTDNITKENILISDSNHRKWNNEKLRGVFCGHPSNENPESNISQYDLVLFDDGTYRYIIDYKDNTSMYGSSGTYVIDGNNIVLNYIFKIERDNDLHKNKAVLANGSKSLKISSIDKLEDGNLLLTACNQSYGPLENFYTLLAADLGYYLIEQQ